MNKKQRKAKVRNAKDHRAGKDTRRAQLAADSPASAVAVIFDEAVGTDRRIGERIMHEESKRKGGVRKTVVKILTGSR